MTVGITFGDDGVTHHGLSKILLNRVFVVVIRRGLWASHNAATVFIPFLNALLAMFMQLQKVVSFAIAAVVR